MIATVLAITFSQILCSVGSGWETRRPRLQGSGNQVVLAFYLSFAPGKHQAARSVDTAFDYEELYIRAVALSVDQQLDDPGGNENITKEELLLEM